MEKEGGGEESVGIRYISNTTDCHFARGIIAVNTRWHLKVASSSWCKTQCLPDDVVPRGEHDSRDGEKETVTRTETGAGTERRTSTAMMTSAGMGTKTGAATGTRI